MLKKANKNEQKDFKKFVLLSIWNLHQALQKHNLVTTSPVAIKTFNPKNEKKKIKAGGNFSALSVSRSQWAHSQICYEMSLCTTLYQYDIHIYCSRENAFCDNHLYCSNVEVESEQLVLKLDIRAIYTALLTSRH